MKQKERFRENFQNPPALAVGSFKVLKVLELPEYEKYSKLWEQRKKEYNIAITE
ncbi:MAG: hypothetical protein MJZ11_08295 [Lachnospiraceae bacterium]|nr:hypothetical protein [Lachnospiraceae bacterium]